MTTPGSFEISWIDLGREPKCEPDPAYPNGIDLDHTKGIVESCHTDLPYPTRRCGLYVVKCNICGYTAVITTAGRPDDPRSVVIPCKIGNKKQ